MFKYCTPENRSQLIIPLRAKRVGELIEIRHKKISPTHILSTLWCLWLCDSKANKSPIISAACHGIGRKLEWAFCEQFWLWIVRFLHWNGWTSLQRGYIWTPGWILSCLALKFFQIGQFLTVLGILIDFWLENLVVI